VIQRVGRGYKVGKFLIESILGHEKEEGEEFFIWLKVLDEPCNNFLVC